MTIAELKRELDRLKNPSQAKILSCFFKTGPGEYGEGDEFLGIKVPVQRKIANKYKDISLSEVQELLGSKIHEHRLVALLILVKKYEIGDEKEKKQIFDFYLNNTKNINNWDLVDVTSPNIVGNYLLDKDRKILYKLAKSSNLWEKRIAIISTFAFIKNKEHKDTIAISEILLQDKHDLIHKAVGWMLREVGKRVSEEELEKFLKKHHKTMPRTMLRYAIERFRKEKKQKYLKK
jgi:3-methyladenine DNA glycosylase AlkD